MITSIKQWFAPPVFEGDEKKTHRVKLLNAMINLAVCFTVLIVVGNLLDSSTPPRNFVINFVFIGIFLFLRRLLFAGRVKLVGNLIVISAFILMTASVASEGTILSPATTFFSLTVIISGFIFNLWGIITATIVSSLVVAGLILAHHAGILPPPNYTESTFQWFVFTCTFGLTGWLTYFYNQLTEQALERLRMEIRERERAETELRRLTQAVEQSPASIVITDLSGNIEYVNPRFTQVTGYGFDEAIGKNPRILKTGKTPSETYLQLWETITAGKEWRGEFANRKKDGSVYYESATISPITGTNGVATHYLAVKEDITERKRTEALLQMRLKLLEFAATHSLDEFMQKALDEIAIFTDSAVGFYHFVEPDQKTLSLQAWSTRTLKEFCKAEGKGMHYDIDKAGAWVECVRQGKPVIHNDYAALPASRRKGLPPGHAEVIRELVVPVYRVGSIVSILGVGNKSSDYTEKDVEAVSYLADVTWEIVKRKQAEVELRKLSRAIEQSQVSVMITDTAGAIEYVNPKFVEVTGYKADEVLGKNPRILKYSGKLPEEYQILWETVLAGREWRGIFHNRKKHGESFWESTIISPILNEHGKITHFVAVKEDITERKQAEDALKSANEQLNLRITEVENLQAELREQAIRDPLTKLYNRRYLNETLAREIARAERENDPLSVIISDIDHFKTINDTYGHPVGDKFLVEIASLMKNHARSSDIVCRYGGEEFLLVFPGTALDSAAKRAEEIRQKCAEVIIKHEGKDLMITMSFGVATYPEHGKEAEEIIIKADKSLYQSKHNGRNRVMVWSENQ